MKKAFTLPTCKTCQRIFDDLKPLSKGCTITNIKEEGVSEEDLDEMKKRAGSYEALFSRRAIKYKTMGLKEKTLTEDDYKNLILNEYTFLKRPVFINDHEIYIGNSKKTIELLKKKLEN